MSHGLAVLATANYLRQKKLVPRSAAKLAEIAQNIAEVERGAEMALRLLESLERSVAVRLPHPGWDETLAQLRKAVRGD